MRTMLKRFVVVVVVALAACSKSAAPPPAPSTAKDPAVARVLISKGAVVIDVRTPEEFAAGHLPNATNIAVQDFGSHLDDVDKLVASDHSRAIVVYCAAGSRAAKAKAQLEAAGYSHVVNGGGYDDLQ
jgi:phage shock protein E